MKAEDKVQLREVYPVHERVRKIAYIKSREEYEQLYQEFMADPPGFWAKQADEYLTFFKKWDKVEEFNFDVRRGPIYLKYFEGAKLNVSYNCLDRQLEKRGDKVAIQWVGNEPTEEKAITYRELHREVCKFANVLKAHGIKKGDRVCIYMPMVPEAGVAMLACTRIGAVHTVVFGGFSPEALSRIRRRRSWSFATDPSAAPRRSPRRRTPMWR
jgi:acetyl-CoA synthetase